MKHWYLIALISAVTFMNQMNAKTETRSTKNFSKSTFIGQALKDIKQEISDRTGVFRVKKEYKLEGQEPLAVATKIDFCGYRQPPKSSKKHFKDGTVHQTIEVIYKPHDAGSLSLVMRNASGRGCRTETVDISTVTCV